MDISPVAVYSPTTIHRTNFKSHTGSKADSFEKTTSSTEVPDYPQVTSYKPIQHKRKRMVEIGEKRLAQRTEEKMRERNEIRRQYSALDSRVEELLNNIIDTVSSKYVMSLNMLRKQIGNDKNDIKTKEYYANAYVKRAEILSKMLSELEKTQAEIDEMHSNGSTDKAQIPDLRINLSPENLDFYREQIAFDPYSMVEE